MSLLSSLGLPALPKGARPPVAIGGADAAPASTPPPAPSTPAAKDASSAAPGADSAAAARALGKTLDAKAKAAREAYAKLVEHEPKVDAALATATGDEKKALLEKKAAIATHVALLEREMKVLEADRLALDDPRSDAKTYNAILARQKASTATAKTSVVDDHSHELEKKRGETRRTAVTTSYADGKAVTRTDDRTRSVGLGGASATSEQTREVLTADGRTTTTASRSDKVSKDGYASEASSKREHVVDGKTSSIEKKRATQVGPGGASHTEERTEMHADGTATSRSATSKVERGDGRMGATRSTSSSTTDASGAVTKSGTSTKGGMIAGKDGIGAYGEREKSVERTSASGLKTGAVAGLNANVVCNVKAMEGSNPPTFDLSISINLGVSASVSGGQDKQGAEHKASVKASGSAAVFMNRHYVLREAEASTYVAGLKEASKGGGGATRKEFGIIRAGVSKSWDVAREMYLAASGKAGSAADVDRMRAGESVEVGRKSRAGVAVSADAKGFGLELGAERSHDQGTKVTKEADGSASYDSHVGDAKKGSVGAKVSMGVVEGGASFSHAVTTSTGYKISIAPTMKNARAMQDELARCGSQAELDAFAAAHPETVKEKTAVKGRADTQGASMGIAGAKANLAYSNSVDESRTTDGSGKLISQKTTGANSSGLDLSLGKLKVGASSKEQAVATTGADGETSVDVTHTDTATDIGKFAEAHLPFMGKKKPAKGALAAVTGATEEPDTDTHDIKGISLSGGDLAYLGDMACSDFKLWMRACPSPRMLDDWRKAGNAVRKAGGDKATVARELARFVGADAGNRADIVNALVRPAGDVSTGARYEFPDSLAAVRASYESLVVAESERRVDSTAKAEGDAKAAAAGAELVSQLDHLSAAVGSASGFSQPAVQGEMLSAINKRLAKVQARIAALGGGKKNTDADEKAALDRYNRLLGACRNYKEIEDGCFVKIQKTFKNGSSPDLGETIANGILVKQVRDLHATWRPDYDEMAALAQENEWGAGIYWKYRPDYARFERAIKGDPGAASAAEPEKADKRRKPPEPPAPPVSKDPLGDGERAVKAMSQKSAQTTEQKLPAAKNRAHGAGNRLFLWIKADRKAAAVTAHNAGMEKMKTADAHFARCKPGNADDFNAYGAIAMDDYAAAGTLFAQGLAAYPKGAPPKV